MTDVSTAKAYADPQLSTVATYGAPPPFTDRSPGLDGVIEEEESSVIKCICGFQEDDGSTVLCEKCDTWQHILCYYNTDERVPEVHECTECQPRPIDAKGAAEKQRQRRELQSVGERKGKPRTGPKSGKKRAKDPLGQVQPNGWAVHTNNDLHYGTERKSGSPRDQPPPSKRPKTHHRSSASVSMPSQVPNLAPGSRKRAASTLHNGQSPSKSPANIGANGYPAQEFSPEFLQLYRQPEPPIVDSNSFTDLRVANDISLWLNDRDALAEATDGKEPSEIFSRVDMTIEDLESTAPLIVKQKEEASDVTVHGLHPQWQYLTVEDSIVPNGGFVGELKGHIGRIGDYFSNPANRWDFLQHPEPFVFFPPHLPIYIDTRREGTILRYVRRSCRPNLDMKILTQSHQGGYHFCFTAKEDIHPDDELTVGWDIPPEIHQLLARFNHGDKGAKKMEHLSQWISRVLANFGGCACQRSKEPPCFLLEMARRSMNNHADAVQPPKATKGKKSKKSHISPVSTGHATNSRAGSENNRDGREDDRDSRSPSDSHSKPGSRDITPMTHLSVDASDLKMSDRERRKIQQQERLFEQLEYDQLHGHKRKKRNSAGSTLNTPSFSSSKQLGHAEPSPSTTKSREHSHGVSRKAAANSSKTNGTQPVKQRSIYVDSATQTDPEPNASSPTTALTRRREMRPPMSFKRRLLREVTADRMERERSRSVKLEAHSPVLHQVASTQLSPMSPGSPLKTMTSVADSTTAAEVSALQSAQTAPQEDVEMKDAEEALPSSPKISLPKIEEMPDAPALESSSGTLHPPIQADPSPWTVIPSTEAATHVSTASPPQPTHLQIHPPPTPEPSLHLPSIESAITPGSASNVLGAPVAQSPISAVSHPSPFSPSVTSAVTPGPARKKLSLSDYAASRKAKLAQSQSQSSAIASPPLRQAPSASSPALSHASLPPQGSPARSPGITATLGTVHEETKPASYLPSAI